MATRRLTSEAERRKSLPRKIFLLVLLLSGAAPGVRADQILLKNGNRLEGRVTATAPGRIRVELDAGSSIEIELDQVAERIPGRSPLELFPERLRAMPREDRDGFIELARWGEERGIKRCAREAWREVLRLDPHQETARQRLGYALHRNRWVLRDALEDAGFVLHRGLWVTPARVAEMEAEERAGRLDDLLADAGHDNPFVRENAMHELLQLDDPALIPALRRRLSDEDPLRRMWAGRVLSNFPFEEWGQLLYRATLGEVRSEVRSAWGAILRSSGDARIGGWLATDLTQAGADPSRRHALLALAATCPTHAVVEPLIGWLEDPQWGPLSRRLLEEWLGPLPVPAEDVRARWAGRRESLPADLGTGWLSSD